jgi:hypothetical protein
VMQMYRPPRHHHKTILAVKDGAFLADRATRC